MKLRLWYVEMVTIDGEVKTVEVYAPNFVHAGLVAEHMFNAKLVLHARSPGKVEQFK